MHIAEDGKGPLVVLCHGWRHQLERWLRLDATPSHRTSADTARLIGQRPSRRRRPRRWPGTTWSYPRRIASTRCCGVRSPHGGKSRDRTNARRHNSEVEESKLNDKAITKAAVAEINKLHRENMGAANAEHSKETIVEKPDQYKAAVARIESLGGKVEELHLSADEVIWLSSYSDRNIQMALPFCAKGRDLDTVRELAQAHLRIEMAANLSEEDRTWLCEQPDQDVIEAARHENRIEEIVRCARVWVPRRVKYKLRAATNMVARQAASRLNLSDLAKFEWLLDGKGSITFCDKRHVWTIQLREATAEDANKIPAFERAITERTGEVVLAEQEQWKREEAEGRHE